MAVTQDSYPNDHRGTTTTRAKVRSSVYTTGAKRQIAFDDDGKAREVAEELAKLLHCLPDDFGYGDQEGRPVEISVEDAIIECALAIAHLKLGLPLPPRLTEDLPA